MSDSPHEQPDALDPPGTTPGWYLQVGLDYLGPYASRGEAEQRWQSFFGSFTAVRPAVLVFR